MKLLTHIKHTWYLWLIIGLLCWELDSRQKDLEWSRDYETLYRLALDSDYYLDSLGNVIRK